MTDKEKIIEILEEFKWGKIPENERSIASTSTCANVVMRGIRPCCAICPACNCHKKTEEVAGQIISWFTGIVEKRSLEVLQKNQEVNKEYEELKRQCPWCGTGGMYQYYVDGARHYRLCKWCGILQNRGEKSRQCTMIQCVLDGRHRYWTVGGLEKRKCVHCGGKMEKVIIPEQKK